MQISKLEERKLQGYKRPTVGAMGFLYAFSFILLKVTFTVYLYNLLSLQSFYQYNCNRFGVYVVKYFYFKSSLLPALKGGLRVHLM